MSKLMTLSAAAAMALGLVVLPGNSAQAGRAGGPGSIRKTFVAGRSVDVYQIKFVGGERTRIRAKGRGDIDLIVLNECGRVVARDVLDDNEPVVSFVPEETQICTVRVINNEHCSVRYSLWTN